MAPGATTTIISDDSMMDFSVERESIPFKVDDDVFHAVADIAAELAMDYAQKLEVLQADTTNVESQKEILHSTMRLVLFPESAERFIERLSDQLHPIGQKRVADITQWLLEQYGLRPTESDSASSPGSENQEDGTN